MSGGAAVTGRNAPELVRAGDPAKPWRSRGDYTAGAFRPTKEGMALTALGSLDPETADVSPQRLGRRSQQQANVRLKLPRFRGHPTFWVEGVHDVEAKSTLPT